MKNEPELLAEIPLKGGYTVDVWSCGRIDLPATRYTLPDAVELIAAIQKAVEVMRAKKIDKSISNKGQSNYSVDTL